MSNDKLNPLGDHVAIEIVEQEKSKGGIYIPDKARGNQRDAQFGRVIAGRSSVRRKSKIRRMVLLRSHHSGW